MQDTDRLLSVSEVAAYIGVTPKTVYLWLRRGELPGQRAGWHWRVRQSVLEEWLANRRRRQSRRNPPERILERLAAMAQRIRYAYGREFSSDDIARIVREGRAERAAGVY